MVDPLVELDCLLAASKVDLLVASKAVQMVVVKVDN